MIEYINNVRMNYSFYRGNDSYSDGDIENELLNMVRENLNLTQIVSEDNRWPILYHLSSIRHNLLDWYPFNSRSELLEIGAGCGAMTGLLCDKVGSVTCIELSKRRSLINAYRHSDKNNLEIVVGNLNDIKLTEKYDYITLIGVLEYAALYTEHEFPYHTFLNNIKKLLKEDGKIIIAIENKFGLKYWAGSREDHTGRFFDGLENYPFDQKIATFSKMEMESILNKVGFRQLEFFYPFPDYKMPTQIYSDKRLPRIGEITSQNHNYDHSRAVLFDEESVMNNIISNNMFTNFANSFLVICTL